MSADTTYLSTLRQALTFWEPNSQITADDLRDALDAAQVPENARGGLFMAGVAKGYLAPMRLTFSRSKYGPAKGHLLRVYFITRKAQREAETRAAL